MDCKYLVWMNQSIFKDDGSIREMPVTACRLSGMFVDKDTQCKKCKKKTV